jgi:predicted DCC family thiol-disulfide oxidoreductase YuxK
MSSNVSASREGESAAMGKARATAPVLLYDGLCGLCNRYVQAVLKHDRRGTIRFAALQSDYGRAVVGRHPALKDVDSLVFVEPSPDTGEERVSIRSTAALRVAAHTGGVCRLWLIAYVIPRSLRDRFYDLVARYRYRMFGKYDSCRLPPPNVRDRFLDVP